MGRAERLKGANYERECAQLLRPLDPEAKRNVAETQQSSWDIITNLPLIIQCKNFVRWHMTPHKAYEQANRHRSDGKIPVVFARISRQSPDLAIVSLDDFLALVEKVYGKRPEL